MRSGCGTYTDPVGYSYDGVDLRKHPEAYRIGRSEQGVFHAEPYKSELLPLWAFKNEGAARVGRSHLRPFPRVQRRGRFRRDGCREEVLADGVDSL